MRAYSNGDGALPDYLAVLSGLHQFWATNRPASEQLPKHYHSFYHAYIGALREDTGQTYELEAITRRNEIAFFYVLIGSSLGARHILQRQSGDNLPRKNLRILAEEGGSLWKTFVGSYLSHVRPEQEQEVLKESEHMFDTLYRQICPT